MSMVNQGKFDFTPPFTNFFFFLNFKYEIDKREKSHPKDVTKNFSIG